MVDRRTTLHNSSVLRDTDPLPFIVFVIYEEL